MRIRSVVSAVVLAAATFAATGATAASAATCQPLTVSYGGTSVTVCLAPSFPPPGSPSVGFYVALDGYVEVCTPGCITIPVQIGTTGAAIIPGQTGTASGGPGAPIPNTCVGTICTPSNLPGFQVTLFGDANFLYVWVNGTQYRFDIPSICQSTAGSC
jgi:hypothetical protein